MTKMASTAWQSAKRAVAAAIGSCSAPSRSRTALPGVDARTPRDASYVSVKPTVARRPARRVHVTESASRPSAKSVELSPRNSSHAARAASVAREKAVGITAFGSCTCDAACDNHAGSSSTELIGPTRGGVIGEKVRGVNDGSSPMLLFSVTSGMTTSGGARVAVSAASFSHVGSASSGIIDDSLTRLTARADGRDPWRLPCWQIRYETHAPALSYDHASRSGASIYPNLSVTLGTSTEKLPQVRKSWFTHSGASVWLEMIRYRTLDIMESRG